MQFSSYVYGLMNPQKKSHFYAPQKQIVLHGSAFQMKLPISPIIRVNETGLHGKCHKTADFTAFFPIFIKKTGQSVI
jgi:hypothetical protein